jgi:hypothetical protein
LTIFGFAIFYPPKIIAIAMLFPVVIPLVTPLAGMPRNLTLMLLVPLGGAAEKVRVVPDTVYVLGSCNTPVTDIRIDDVFAGATVIVKAVWLPVPENVSTRKAAVNGWLPM